MKCCICGIEINGYGNNPQGAVWKTPEGEIFEAEFDADARCCDECNTRFVIPGRIYRMNKEHKHDSN